MKLLKKAVLISAVILSMIFVSSCASKIGYDDMNRADTATTGFNSTDLKSATNKLTYDMLSSHQVDRITAKGRPVLAFSEIKNKTEDLLDTEMLADTVTNDLLNSDKFDIVPASKMNEVIKEMKNQQGGIDAGMMNPATAVAFGQHTGASYLLSGTIADNVQRGKNERTVYYLVTLKLIDLHKGLLVWQGQYDVRKLEEKGTFGW